MLSAFAQGIASHPLAYIILNIDPVLLRIGALAVRWYGVMYVVALAIGLWVISRWARQLGLQEDQVWGLFIWAAIAGLIGGRLYFVIQQPDLVKNYLLNPINIIAVWNGGMAFFGAMFGGALALVISAWRWHMPLWSLLDVGALGMTIGQAIGRVGNIINGDIVGYKTNGWGFEYTNPHTFGPVDVPVQPANLYELLISLALFLILWSLRKRIHPEGMLAMLYVVLYSISQFFIFFVRANDIVLGGLKQAQVTAIVVIMLTLPIIAYLLRKDRLGERRSGVVASSRADVADSRQAARGQPAATPPD